MGQLPDPKSTPIINVDLTALSAADMRLGDAYIGKADLAVDQRSDDAGAYTHIELAPRSGP